MADSKQTEALVSQVQTVTEDGFEALVNSHRDLIIGFSAPWCGPCQANKPVVEALAKELSGIMVFGIVNIDDEPDLASEYEISSIPTWIFFRDGVEVYRANGAQSRDDFLRLVKATFSK